jgi:hypothetical protein
MNKKKHQPEMVRVTFGSTTIVAVRPSPSELRSNILEGQRALARARDAIITPGVKVDLPKGVPFYHAHPEKPGYIIRDLDGKQETGMVENGMFKSVISVHDTKAWDEEKN